MRAEDILRLHNLKNTGCRKYIINELIKSEQALSENEIKASLPDLFDRVTFYRSLKTLDESNIIHRIALGDGTIKYALNQEDKFECNKSCHCNHTHKHMHAHFHCVDCDEVLCVDAVVDSLITLSEGFSIQSAQILLEGICPQCEKQHATTG